MTESYERAGRCVNIDWLEIYCLEYGSPHTPDYYRSRGFFVTEREYGTRHMAEVFTLHDNLGDPFIEVRRSPRPGTNGHHTIYPDNACTLRFVNRYCYFDYAARIMSDFIVSYELEFRRIARLDLAIDFVKFDSGDKPADFVRRYVHHKYAKVYQANRALYGEDRWDGCTDDSISWGNKKSMVVTRLYNKTKELKQVKDKPWIRQAWFESGIIDDPTLITKTIDGQVKDVDVWRLEFQINSSARQWYFIDKEDGGQESVMHTLECYETRQQMVLAISCLVKHYFSFRKYKRGRRKYDCRPKILFDFKEVDETYKLSNVAVDSQAYRQPIAMVATLMKVRERVATRPQLVNEVDDVINYFREIDGWQRQTYGISPKELQLKLKIALEQKQAIKPVSVDTGRDYVSQPPKNPSKPQ